MQRAYIRPAHCGPSPSRCRIPSQRSLSFFPAAPIFARPAPHPFAWGSQHNHNHHHGNPLDAALSPLLHGPASAFPFPSFPGGGVAADLDGLFRAVDAADGNVADAAGREGEDALGADRVIRRHTRRSYAPSFDATEDESGYHLAGELPGVESKDVDVRFVDARTLRVSGNTETETTTARDARGNVMEDAGASAAVEGASAAQPQGQAEAVQATEEKDDGESVRSASSTGSYVKPSVEDEAEAERAEKEGDAVMTPATEGGDAPAGESQPARQEQRPRPRYWISERTSGSFERRFRFPARVDQDGVTASLRNGVLSIRVPKAKVAEREMRRIEVE